MMALDRPKLRAHPTCQICLEPKMASSENIAGALMCWECYHEFEMRYGNPEVEAALDRIEASI